MFESNFVFAPSEESKLRLGLAAIWLKRGRPDRAVLGLRSLIEKDPDNADHYLALIAILADNKRWSDVIQVCRDALIRFPNNSLFHKRLIAAEIARGGLVAAEQAYRLIRRDGRPLDLAGDEILACSVVRNERLRLPYFLEYHRRLGVDRFLVIDNMSDDGTVEYLLDQHDVYLWQSDLTFYETNFGSTWFEILLQRYGVGHWCVMLDADELLVYPDCEEVSLYDYCRRLTSAGFTAVSAIFIDMYSDRPVSETVYSSGESFLATTPYFDRQYYHQVYEQAGPFQNMSLHFGGMRHRVFGDQAEYLVTKVPLLRYARDLILAGGQHWTSYPTERIAQHQAAVLHFKYFATFSSYVQQEIARGQRPDHEDQYLAYSSTLSANEELVIFDDDLSERYQSSRTLLDLGIMQPGPPSVVVEFPPIAPVPPGPRPFWSVMLTVYDRLDHIERALRSVLAQDPGPEEMQIEVVCDGGVKAVQRELPGLVAQIAGDRVSVTCATGNLGQPHIFNWCLDRSQGDWVHILHDDDWLEPGYYQALRAGITEAPQAGAAFTRHVINFGPERQPWHSWLERDDPGLIDAWLELIAVDCRLQFSSLVMKREVVEELGGFCPQARSSFDWELWKRIAVHYPFWFDPRVLVHIGRTGSALSDTFIRSGKQIADSVHTIAISRSYLPPESAARLSRRAAESWALYALDLARIQGQHGDLEATLVNMRAALQADPSAWVLTNLGEMLQEIGGE